jgi:hypothetical protein
VSVKRKKELPIAIEVKWSSILLGILAIMWAAHMMRVGHVYSADTYYDYILAALLFASGIAQGLGAWLPHRALRQVGLITSGLTWFALCLSFLGAWWLSYAAVLASLGLLTLSCFVREVLRKPRDKRPAT